MCCRDMIFDVAETVFSAVSFFRKLFFAVFFFETGMWKSLIFFALYMFFWKSFFAVFDFFSLETGRLVFLLCFFCRGAGRRRR